MKEKDVQRKRHPKKRKIMNDEDNKENDCLRVRVLSRYSDSTKLHLHIHPSINQ